MAPKTPLAAAIVALMTASSSPLTAAFAPPAFAARRHPDAVSTSTASLGALPDPSAVVDALSSASIHLSTIDSDIDSIPTDQFGLVFAGGMVVMAGGLVSALVVGAILEGGNNYANVIADSYAQGGDESFWESLTPEQREETERLLRRVKDSKDTGEKEEGAAASGSESEVVVAEAKKEGKKEEISMFSDYD